MAYFSRRKTVQRLKEDPRLKKVVERNFADLNFLAGGNNTKIIHDAIVRLAVPKNKPLVPTFVSFFSDPNPAIRGAAFLAVSCIGSPKNFAEMSRLMYDKDPRVQHVAIDVFGRLAREHPEALPFLEERGRKEMDLATLKAVKQALSLSKKYGQNFELYMGLERNKDFVDKKRVFARAPQFKDGSHSILFGGRFFGKMRAVRISKSAFLAWKKAHDAGIPVEPIIMKVKKLSKELPKAKKPRLISHKDGSVTVFAKIINGVSMTSFIRNPENLKYFDELKRQVVKIKSAMEREGIEHGHYHSGNFVVRMIKGKPKVYLIDFDRARLVQKQ